MRHVRDANALAGLLAAAGWAVAAPVATVSPVSGPDRTVAVAGAAVAGLMATADVAQDQVEIRDVRGQVVGLLTRANIGALLPWMSLDGSDDGPVAVALSDSGRLAFVAIRDDDAAPDGQPADAVLRWEIDTGDLRVFVRHELGGSAAAPGIGLAHFRGRLYLGTGADTRVYNAQANTLAGTLVTTTLVPASSLAIDRDQGNLLAVSGSTLRRAVTGNSTLTFTTVGTIASLTHIAWSDHYGGAAQAGLYARCAPGASGGPALWSLSPAMARGQAGFAPVSYIADTASTLGVSVGPIAATADGALLAGTGSDAVLIRDTLDTRLSFHAWAADEFAQVVRFAKGLVSPDGEPAGWVIDGDVQLGFTRFHPASPDGACWTVLACLMSDRLTGDPDAQGIVRTVLRRYAGRSPDGIAPLRSADGIYWHWLDPVTGGPKAGWGDGYATLSTMKIVLAAARAAQMYPADADIRASARAIICGVRNWDAYLGQSPPFPLEFLGAPGGGPLTPPNDAPYHEGIIFVEQAAAYGGASSLGAFNFWRARQFLPFASFLAGKNVTTGGFGNFQAAFVSLYSLLVQDSIRTDPSWQEHYRNLRLSNAAWTDDNGPKYSTVFSAGTTKPEWGGYNADSLSHHPGDLTTFPSLLAMTAGTGAGGAHAASAGGAYQAYRRGARQTFLTGASILYRRSQVDQTYQPNSAGLPDVVLGALGLAEVLQAGSVAGVLTGPYPSCASLACAADFNADGNLDPDDLSDFITCFFTQAGGAAACPAADFNADGNVDPDDLSDYITTFFAGC